MALRLLTLALVAALLLLQYRLWVGEGSVAEVYNLQRRIDRQQAELARLRKRNAALQAEVVDLRRGLDAIEERARSDLGMIRDKEIYYQVVEPAGEASGD